MANLTVRQIDDNVLSSLKLQAKKNQRSLEAEVRTILANAVNSENQMPTINDLLLLADKIAALTLRVPQTDSAQILSKLRDSR